MSAITITKLTEATEVAAEQISSLLAQLTDHAEPMNTARLQRALEMSGFVYVAKDGDVIVGTVTRVDVHHLVRSKSWIEDFVVDEGYRGQGIATQLLEKAITEAPKSITSINLTSKSKREGSHRLYAKLGFVEREDSAVWRLSLRS